MVVSQLNVSRMQAKITDEIFFALGFSRTGAMRRSLGWLFSKPTRNFSRIFAAADAAVEGEGLPAGARSLLEHLRVKLQVQGREVIPVDGPMIVVSNHPGAYDSVAIAACVPRADLKILVADTSFYHTLPNISQKLIYAGNDLASRMLALRSAVRWLQSGGALLQFGSGTIDADPSLESTAEIELDKWSASLDIMLRRAPETQVVLSIASRVLLRRFAEHPLVKFYRKPLMRRRLAEFLQIIQQLMKPETVEAQACLSFATPVSVDELWADAPAGQLLPVLLERAKSLLKVHQQAFCEDPAGS
jgi:hypothetical protein